MINFFRKIRKGLLNQNKFNRYLLYASGEILLVVVGIVIALQLNNWNEQRKNIKKENYYLQSIKSSIELSQEEMMRVIGDAEMITSSADTLFFLLATNKFDRLEGTILDSLLWTASDYSLISLNDGPILEILNTGALDIIRDEDIRVILASWNERIHKIRKFEAETEYLSHNYQEYLSNFVDASRYVSDSMRSTVIPEKRQELLTDPLIRNYLNSIRFSHSYMHRIYSNEKAFLDSLSTLIDQYLAE